MSSSTQEIRVSGPSSFASYYFHNCKDLVSYTVSHVATKDIHVFNTEEEGKAYVAQQQKETDDKKRIEFLRNIDYLEYNLAEEEKASSSEIKKKRKRANVKAKVFHYKAPWTEGCYHSLKHIHTLVARHGCSIEDVTLLLTVEEAATTDLSPKEVGNTFPADAFALWKDFAQAHPRGMQWINWRVVRPLLEHPSMKEWLVQKGFKDSEVVYPEFVKGIANAAEV